MNNHERDQEIESADANSTYAINRDRMRSILGRGVPEGLLFGVIYSIALPYVFPDGNTPYWSDVLHHLVFLPLWVIFGCVCEASYWTWRPKPRHLCPECGYCLVGNASGVCPECGVRARPVSRGDKKPKPTTTTGGPN